MSTKFTLLPLKQTLAHHLPKKCVPFNLLSLYNSLLNKNAVTQVNFSFSLTLLLYKKNIYNKGPKHAPQ